VSEANGCVAAVCAPGWHCLPSVGWPSDNNRLLANLLVGGDADVPLELCG
jgi:hypothetical protein